MVSFSDRTIVFKPFTVVVLCVVLVFGACTQNEVQIQETAQAQAVQTTKNYNEGENVSSYTVTRTTGVISIDGKLDL